MAAANAMRRRRRHHVHDAIMSSSCTRAHTPPPQPPQPRAYGRRGGVTSRTHNKHCRLHDANAFMMCARHERIIIVHMMRGVTWRDVRVARRGAARCDAHEDEDG